MESVVRELTLQSVPVGDVPKRHHNALHGDVIGEVA
jgi:hypothetical protein